MTAHRSGRRRHANGGRKNVIADLASIEKLLAAVPGETVGTVARIGGSSAVMHAFQPLEELLEDLNLTYAAALTSDTVIRIAVGKLREENPYVEKYVQFLSEVDAAMSANYIVPALNNASAAPYASRVLINKGPSNATVKPLVGALGNSTQSEPAAPILKAYGACRTTVSHLMGAFLAITAEQVTVAMQRRSHNARDVLLSYGEAALEFIFIPRRGTPTYGQVTGLANQIRQNK